MTLGGFCVSLFAIFAGNYSTTIDKENDMKLITISFPEGC